MSDQHDHAAHPHRLAEELHQHLKEIPQHLKEIPYQLEQQPPNKPSFLTVVILSGVAIIILFIIAIIVLHLAHGRLEHPFRGHPSSQLILPAASSTQSV
ncbi:MAG TPA: hypothetical protein VFA99_04070 [Acidobacteriaceae bacterium]|nr:hypothetical protein [Acidobacteriaceae bacterium]